MTHAEKQDGDFHGSMFNDLYDNTNWRLLGEKTTNGDVIAAASLPVLPANGATCKNDTTSIDAEHVVHIHVDHTKDEHQMDMGFLVGELAHSSVLFDGAHVRAPEDAAREVGASTVPVLRRSRRSRECELGAACTQKQQGTTAGGGGGWHMYLRFLSVVLSGVSVGGVGIASGMLLSCMGGIHI